MPRKNPVVLCLWAQGLLSVGINFCYARPQKVLRCKREGGKKKKEKEDKQMQKGGKEEKDAAQGRKTKFKSQDKFFAGNIAEK